MDASAIDLVCLATHVAAAHQLVDEQAGGGVAHAKLSRKPADADAPTSLNGDHGLELRHRQVEPQPRRQARLLQASVDRPQVTADSVGTGSRLFICPSFAERRMIAGAGQGVGRLRNSTRSIADIVLVIRK